MAMELDAVECCLKTTYTMYDVVVSVIASEEIGQHFVNMGEGRFKVTYVVMAECATYDYGCSVILLVSAAPGRQSAPLSYSINHTARPTCNNCKPNIEFAIMESCA